MEKRIEIMFPVYEPILKKRLHAILQLILQDNVKAREQDSSGYYHYVEPASGEPAINSQLVLFEWASRFLDMNNE
jgi:polyphosphate kinase